MPGRLRHAASWRLNFSRATGRRSSTPVTRVVAAEPPRVCFTVWMSDDPANDPVNPVIEPDPRIDPRIEAEIRRIEPEALRLGWSETRLWGSAFWPISARGLVAILDPTDRIVGVDSECISIAKNDRSRTVRRFSKFDA